MNIETGRYFIFCDGGKRRGVAYGSFKIFTETGVRLHHEQTIFGSGTSNLAEYLITLQSIRRALELGYKNVIVYTDSALVKQQVQDGYVCNYEHLRIVRDKIRKEIVLFDSFEIIHVSRNIIKQQLGH